MIFSSTAYITPSKLRLINKTSTSFLFQYTPREKHGAHVGYLVSFNGSYMVDGSAASHVDSYKLHDGLLFNVSCLLPYHRYELTITPLEVQSELASIKMVEATLASGKSIYSRENIIHRRFHNQILSQLEV